MKNLIDPISNDPLEIIQEYQVIRARTHSNNIAEITLLDGVPHCFDDQPAYKEFLEGSDKVIRLAWFHHGVQHRDSKPSSLVYFDDGKLLARNWYKEGVLHRENGPSTEQYDQQSGAPVQLEFCRNGLLYRTDGPAFMQIDPVTRIVTEEAWNTLIGFDGHHRDDGGAAFIHRNRQTGISNLMLWVQRSRLFRQDGVPPVEIRDATTGTLLEKRWESDLFPSPNGPKPS